MLTGMRIHRPYVNGKQAQEPDGVSVEVALFKHGLDKLSVRVEDVSLVERWLDADGDASLPGTVAFVLFDNLAATAYASSGDFATVRVSARSTGARFVTADGEVLEFLHGKPMLGGREM